MSFIWIEKPVARAIHHAQLREHGGSPGVRDEGRLESALARPLNLATYGDPGVAECAAAYGYGIARNSHLSMATSALLLFASNSFSP